MLVRGRSNKEIGATLGIEVRTVKAHVEKLLRKVGVQNRVELSIHAVTHSLVPLQSKTEGCPKDVHKYQPRDHLPGYSDIYPVNLRKAHDEHESRATPRCTGV